MNPVKITKVDAVSGAFMIFSKNTYQALNGFDERFFMYLEDIDFCYRAKTELGVVSTFFTGTEILHIAGESSNNRDRVNHVAWIDSRRKYLDKNEESFFLRLVVNSIFTLDDMFISSRIKRYESSRS